MSKPNLAGAAPLLAAPLVVIVAALVSPTLSDEASKQVAAFGAHHGAMTRSEERRVGKECRSRWSPYH